MKFTETASECVPVVPFSAELSIPCEITISSHIEIVSPQICLSCGGTGKIKAMQSYACYGGGTVRAPDTYVKCRSCDGRGCLP